MNRRSLLAFLAASPVVLASALRGQSAAAQTRAAEPVTYNHLPSERVGTRSWYIDRLADQVLMGAAICTRDNGALFDWCREQHAAGVLRGPTAFGGFGANGWAEKRLRWFGPDPVTGTRHYIYWDAPRSRAQREALLPGLRAAAWRDDSFGKLPDDTFIQPATGKRYA